MANLVITLQITAILVPLFHKNAFFRRFPPYTFLNLKNAGERKSPASTVCRMTPSLNA